MKLIPFFGAEAGLFAATAFFAHAPDEPLQSVQPSQLRSASSSQHGVLFPWAALGIFEDVSFRPTPGAGYSEGGDVFSPVRNAPLAGVVTQPSP